MSYILENPGLIARLIGQHLMITGTALAISVLIALPLGYLIARNKRLAGPIFGVLGTVYTIPSIALIILFIPLFGLNSRSVIVALVLYTQVILVRNIVAGLNSIDPAILEAARGMGMNGWQIWWRVQLPLAMPLILAGGRIAAVVAIAIATIGAKFSAGGLGTLLFQGIAQAGRYDKIWAGAILVALLALSLNTIIKNIEKRSRPPEQGLGS